MQIDPRMTFLNDRSWDFLLCNKSATKLIMYGAQMMIIDMIYLLRLNNRVRSTKDENKEEVLPIVSNRSRSDSRTMGYWGKITTTL